MPTVRQIVRDAARDNYRFSSIVMGIVKSAPFQMRKAATRVGTVAGRPRSSTEDTSCSSRRSTSPAARSSAVPASPSACRCSTRWCRRWTALAQTAAAPKPRMGFIYLPHGAIMEQWTPADRGHRLRADADPQAARAVPEAADDRQRPREQAGDRAAGARAQSRHLAELRDAARRRQEPYGGVTVDQIAAAHIGQDTPLPSLEVATEGRGGGGACDRNYGCSYGGTISFRTPTTPLPMEADPRKLFERLFGQGDTPQERKAISQQYSSILDLVTREAADLQKTLDAPDRAQLGDYLESVREIERRVQKMEAQDLSSLDAARRAGRHQLRPAPEPDVRHDRAGVPGQPDARLHAS